MIKDEVYKFFADYIFQQSGMVYKQEDYYRLDSRLHELVKFLGVATVDDVYQMYKTNITSDMKAILVNLSTNNETYFFRDVKPYAILSKNIIPEILEKSSVGPINIWSAACSTGQEPYSILMSVSNTLGDAAISRLSLFASDISTTCLEKAKKGIYNGLDVQRGLPATMLIKYFTQNPEDTWAIKKEFISKIKFYAFNLLKDAFPKDMYHVIFCRNILIYQERENKSRILANIHQALKPNGYLILGNGESLIGVDSKFERVTIDNYTVYKKNE